jgi:hypothetical protein
VPDTDTALAEPVAADPGGGPEIDATADAPVAEPTPEAKDKEGKDKEGKDKKGKDKKGKDKKGKDKAPVELGDGPSIAGHPRATRSVERAKAWGALVGFVLGGYLSLPTHTAADAGLRALAAGAILYVAVWAGAVFVWRRLVIVEIKAREASLLAAAQASVARRQGSAQPAGRPEETAGR